MSLDKILNLPVKENYENCEHNDLQIEISEVISLSYSPSHDTV